MPQPFQEFVNDLYLIQTLDELTSLYGQPRRSSQTKVRSTLSPAMQHWLEQSPFFILASGDKLGMDCSPRGDAPGKAIRVIDESTLAIPDRQGNNRIDTLRNILQDPRVGLVFLIPGIDEALRIKGVASISIDPDLLERFAIDGVRPATVILVRISSAYVQNARAIRSSGLWDSDYLANAASVPDARALLTSR